MPELPEPVDDNLVIPEVAEHSKYKHYFIRRYMDAFTSSMRKKWAGLHYIDLFAGAGVERLRNSGKLDWGSPMIAAQMRFKFTKLHLCENDSQKYEALKSRIERIRSDSQILFGNAKDKIYDIVDEIPNGTLSLAFLDPYGLHMEMWMLELLAKKRVDMIIFFPDRLDALRNWEAYYLENPESNLDHCFGNGIDWRTMMKHLPPEKQAEELRNMYISQIKNKLGYTHFDFERIKTVTGQPIYYLIFCSRDEFAARLWRAISGKKPDGQRTFNFDAG